MAQFSDSTLLHTVRLLGDSSGTVPSDSIHFVTQDDPLVGRSIGQFGGETREDHILARLPLRPAKTHRRLGILGLESDVEDSRHGSGTFGIMWRSETGTRHSQYACVLIRVLSKSSQTHDRWLSFHKTLIVCKVSSTALGK